MKKDDTAAQEAMAATENLTKLFKQSMKELRKFIEAEMNKPDDISEGVSILAERALVDFSKAQFTLLAVFTSLNSDNKPNVKTAEDAEKYYAFIQQVAELSLTTLMDIGKDD